MSISSINTTILNTLWNSIPETLLDPKVILTIGVLAGIYLFNKYGREQQRSGQIVALRINNQELNNKGISLVDTLPHEVLDHILSFLSPEDLAGRASCVSRIWNELAMRVVHWQAFDLREHFRKEVRFCLKEEWENDAGFKYDIPDPDKRQVIAAIKSSPFFKSGERTLTFFLRHKDLTMRKLKAFGESPLQGNSIPEIWFSSDILNDPIMDESSPETEYILIANAVLEESRGKIFEDQQATVKVYSEHEVAGHIEALALPIVNYVPSGEDKTRLLSDSPLRYARVPQKVGGYHLVIGGFAPARLHVYSYYSFYFDDDFKGVLTMRKFRPLDLGKLAIDKGH